MWGRTHSYPSPLLSPALISCLRKKRITFCGDVGCLLAVLTLPVQVKVWLFVDLPEMRKDLLGRDFQSKIYFFYFIHGTDFCVL